MSKTHTPSDRRYKNRDELRELFEDHEENISAVARECEVHESTIRHWLQKHEIYSPSELTLAQRVNSIGFDDEGDQ